MVVWVLSPARGTLPHLSSMPPTAPDFTGVSAQSDVPCPRPVGPTGGRNLHLSPSTRSRRTVRVPTVRYRASREPRTLTPNTAALVKRLEQIRRLGARRREPSMRTDRRPSSRLLAKGPPCPEVNGCLMHRRAFLPLPPNRQREPRGHGRRPLASRRRCLATGARMCPGFPLLTGGRGGSGPPSRSNPWQ